MTKIPQASRYILQKAWALGQKMAKTERRLKPDISGAHQYASYALFRTTHRHRLEQTTPFVRWEERLQELVERESSGAGYVLDDPRHWDRFHSFVVGPIHSAFWQGWEQMHQLEMLYRQEIARVEASRAQRVVLEVYRAARTGGSQSEHAGKAPASEDNLWEAVAGKVFQETEDHPDLWRMPEPESMLKSRKTG